MVPPLHLALSLYSVLLSFFLFLLLPLLALPPQRPVVVQLLRGAPRRLSQLAEEHGRQLAAKETAHEAAIGAAIQGREQKAAQALVEAEQETARK